MLIKYTLLGLASLSLLLPILGRWVRLPLLSLFSRWIRWSLFAAVFAFLLDHFQISSRPDWVHFVTGCAVWFLLETGYNWIAIKILSRSDLPFFPHFRRNQAEDNWPVDKYLVELKEWLQKNNYRPLDSFKAELYEGVYLRASIYEDSQSMTRIQVLFIPKGKETATTCYTISTNVEDGRRFITDNNFLPYGGYYPANWYICRRPLTGSLQCLLKWHHRRLLQNNLKPVPFEEDPLNEINNQQRTLEKLNTEAGLLIPRPHQEEEGRLTYKGRYRLWKEMWTLAYFGKSVD